MQNEKLKRIITTKSSFPAEEIESMSDADGWNWVYANAKPSTEKLTQFCLPAQNEAYHRGHAGPCAILLQ